MLGLINFACKYHNTRRLGDKPGRKRNPKYRGCAFLVLPSNFNLFTGCKLLFHILISTHDLEFNLKLSFSKVIDVRSPFPIRHNMTHSPLQSFDDILKFPDIVRLYTCLFLYDLLCNAKSSNFITPLLSEQHSYASRIVSSDLLYIPFSRTNIRKFCPIGRCFF